MSSGHMKDTTGAARRCFSSVVVLSFSFSFYTGVYGHRIHPLGELESLITKCHQSLNPRVCNKVSNERVKNHYWVICPFNIIALADINKHTVAVQLVSHNAIRRISCNSARRVLTLLARHFHIKDLINVTSFSTPLTGK